MTTPTMIKVDDIEYRQGYIELTEGIHPNCINIEAWECRGDLIDAPSVRLPPYPETRSNVELELNVEQAKLAIAALQKFVDSQA